MLNCTPQLRKAWVCFTCRRKCGPIRGNLCLLLKGMGTVGRETSTDCVLTSSVYALANLKARQEHTLAYHDAVSIEV